MSDEPIFNLQNQDFIDSKFTAVIETVNNREIRDYAKVLFRNAEETENLKNREIYQLFGKLMVPWLRPAQMQNPFHRIDDFSDEQLSFFSDVVNEIKDDEISSRVSDLLWTRKKDYRMALRAIDSYLSSARRVKDVENWTESLARLERALQIASSLGRTQDKYLLVINEITTFLDECAGTDPLFFSAELMRLLLDRKEGDWEKYAGFAKKLAVSAENLNKFDRAQRYWQMRVRWFRQGKDVAGVRLAQLKLAECHEKESDYNLDNRTPKYLMAIHPLENAIKEYGQAGNVDVKINSLKIKLRDYQSKCVDEMPIISSGEIDISAMVGAMEKALKGKSFKTGLQLLAGLPNTTNVTNLRKQVEENEEDLDFLKFFPKTFYSSSGRVVAVQPSGDEEILLSEMYRYAGITHQLNVRGIIEPGRRILLLEHPCRLSDLFFFLSNNPFISPDRQVIVARGLYEGLNGDFLSAVHFLIPQIEESFRLVLLRKRVVTSAFYNSGVQDEFNLNKLLSDERFSQPLKDLLGEDLIFDFRVILIERFGANLRNEFAHGLLDNDSFYSDSAIYLWWLSLRFYMLPTLLEEV